MAASGVLEDSPCDAMLALVVKLASLPTKGGRERASVQFVVADPEREKLAGRSVCVRSNCQYANQQQKQLAAVRRRCEVGWREEEEEEEKEEDIVQKQIRGGGCKQSLGGRCACLATVAGGRTGRSDANSTCLSSAPPVSPVHKAKHQSS